MAVKYITVTGTYLLPDGVTPNHGYIEFRPNVTLTTTDLGVILPDALQVYLDKDGHFEVELLATDDPLIAPVGWAWQVDEKIKNGNSWYLQTKSVINGGRDPLDITNAYGTGIESPPSVIEVPAPTPIVDKGSLILAGTVFPSAGIGVQDDYYLDTDDHILYGPKGLGHSGTLLTGASTNRALSTSRSYGLRFKALSTGYITALRFYRDHGSGGTTTARTLTLWSDAGAVLATAATVGETTSGWYTVNLNTPYSITAGTYYRVSYNVVNTNGYGYRTVTPVSISSNFIDLAAYQAVGLDTFPNTANPGTDFLADITFQLDLDSWPTAIKSVPVGGVASQVLSKVSSTDFDVAWSSAVSGGVTDHGALTGLTDDDHPQYLNNARGDARYDAAGAATSAVTAHAALADPHPVYLTSAEGGAAFAPISHAHAIGDLPSTLATDAEVTSAITAHTDTDTAPTAKHHTLGTGANQAAAGTHNHSGVYDPAGTAASAVSSHASTAGHELLSSTTPADLGVAAVGNGTTTARSNHVHKMPTAADVGAATSAHTHAGVYDPAGTAASAVSTHAGLADPHTGYLKPVDVVAGTNITLSTTADTVTINSTGSGGGGLDQTTADARYVNIDGDTMTGPFHVSGAAATSRLIYLDTATVPRWALLASADPETGGSVGSNLQIVRFNDAGVPQGPSISIDRSNGDVVMVGLYLNNPVPDGPNKAASKQYVDTRTPKITVATTAPSSPATGDIWVDTN